MFDETRNSCEELNKGPKKERDEGTGKEGPGSKDWRIGGFEPRMNAALTLAP